MIQNYYYAKIDSGTLIQGDTILQISPLAFLRSGRYGYDSAVISDLIFGFYTLSYGVGAISSRNLYLGSYVINPRNGGSAGYGNSLRCLARKGITSLPALLLILYVPKVGDYREVVEMGRIWNY